MERHRKMDVAGPSRKRRTLIAFLFFPLYLAAQTSPSNAQFVERIQQLVAQQRWQELVEILQPVHPRSADLDFYYGTALAKLGRWQEAHDAFESGARLQPQDNRFPLELAGGEFMVWESSPFIPLICLPAKMAPSMSFFATGSETAGATITKKDYFSCFAACPSKP